MPCSFTGPMYYLSKPYEEVLEDYTKMHEKQAAPDWYARKEFRDFLMEPESIAVFVPKEWRGIKDIPPLELQFKPDICLRPTSVMPGHSTLRYSSLPKRKWRVFVHICMRIRTAR